MDPMGHGIFYLRVRVPSSLRSLFAGWFLQPVNNIFLSHSSSTSLQLANIIFFSHHSNTSHQHHHNE